MIFKVKVKLESGNQKIQYGCQAAILKVTLLKINRLLPMTTINMHMKFEIEIPKQTWLMLRKPCHLQTDGRTRWIQYTPPPTSLGGGIIKREMLSINKCNKICCCFIYIYTHTHTNILSPINSSLLWSVKIYWAISSNKYTISNSSNIGHYYSPWPQSHPECCTCHANPSQHCVWHVRMAIITLSKTLNTTSHGPVRNYFLLNSRALSQY